MNAQTVSHSSITLAVNNTTIKNQGQQCGTRLPNYWEGRFDARWVIELIFYAVLILVGVIGNLTVIGSILLAKAYDKNGNIFIINLAVADIIVSISAHIYWLFYYIFCFIRVLICFVFYFPANFEKYYKRLYLT